MSDKLHTVQDPYHEGTEEHGILSLVIIIFGLIAVGVFMYTLTWAVAPH